LFDEFFPLPRIARGRPFGIDGGDHDERTTPIRYQQGGTFFRARADEAAGVPGEVSKGHDACFFRASYFFVIVRRRTL
jgi:hypothetical protein